MNPFSRTALLLGQEGMERLGRARVAVFGLGGVGGHAAEALARSGVGALDLVDRDRVSLTNLNRQVIALRSTVGRLKTDVMAERLREINPDLSLRLHPVFYLPDTADELPLSEYDYVVDAVDTVTAKLTLITRAREAGVPIISALGAGNKLDPTRLRVSDLSETQVDPLARILRKELRKRGIPSLKVVWSDEPPIPVPPDAGAEEDPRRRSTPGSTAFVPSVMGMIIAGEVVKDIAFNRLNKPLRTEVRT